MGRFFTWVLTFLEKNTLIIKVILFYTALICQNKDSHIKKLLSFKFFWLTQKA